MKYLVLFLLFSSLSIHIGATNPDEILTDILQTIEQEKDIPNAVKFHDGGFLGKTGFSLVWRGEYKGRTVAYKLTANEKVYKTELESFAALNAINNSKVEKYGIPNAYVHGNTIKYPYWGIGMTLFDETLKERWDKQNKKISELSILLIFKRVVEILEYFNTRNVIHNDIKPANIFLRGSDVFLGDFNLSEGDDGECDRCGCTYSFASSGLYSRKIRTPMDDLESLVFSMWFVAGIEWDKAGLLSKKRLPEGKTLAKCKKRGTAKSKMTKKCKKFKNKHVQNAFTLIAAEEMLKEKHAPDYKLMVKILNDAIKKVHEGKSGKPQFEWLTGKSSENVIVRNIPITGESSDNVEVRDIPITGDSSHDEESSTEWSVIVKQ